MIQSSAAFPWKVQDAAGAEGGWQGSRAQLCPWNWAGCAREGQGEALAGLQTRQGTQRAEEQLLQHSVLVPSVMLSPVSHSATSNTSGT